MLLVIYIGACEKSSLSLSLYALSDIRIIEQAEEKHEKSIQNRIGIDCPAMKIILMRLTLAIYNDHRRYNQQKKRALALWSNACLTLCSARILICIVLCRETVWHRRHNQAVPNQLNGYSRSLRLRRPSALCMLPEPTDRLRHTTHKHFIRYNGRCCTMYGFACSKLSMRIYVCIWRAQTPQQRAASTQRDTTLYKKATHKTISVRVGYLRRLGRFSSVVRCYIYFFCCSYSVLFSDRARAHTFVHILHIFLMKYFNITPNHIEHSAKIKETII